jgi:glucosamine kinase
MILIADSGSTKCDWAIVDDEKNIIKFTTIGINPYFHDEDFIAEELLKNTDLMKYSQLVKAVYFYGAGCSSKRLKAVVENALNGIFLEAKIMVDHDLVAAAFSTYQDEPAITCILGTGSNSCHFDGDTVREEVPALAYILGDEGSGSYFGKKLLSLFLYKQLPDYMNDALIHEYALTKDIIIDKVYMKPHANVYLASFMKFITKFKHEKFVIDMVKDGMLAFMKIHVLCFKNYKTEKTHFIGSIAFYFEDVLREAAKELNINVGSISKQPIEGLVKYHVNHHFSKILL